MSTNEEVRQHQLKGEVNTSSGTWTSKGVHNVDERLQRGRMLRFPMRYRGRGKNSQVLGLLCKEVAKVRARLTQDRSGLKEADRLKLAKGECAEAWTKVLNAREPERKRAIRYDRVEYRLSLDKLGRPVYILQGKFSKKVHLHVSDKYPARFTRWIERRKK